MGRITTTLQQYGCDLSNESNELDSPVLHSDLNLNSNSNRDEAHVAVNRLEKSLAEGMMSLMERSRRRGGDDGGDGDGGGGICRPSLLAQEEDPLENILSRLQGELK